jgi:hypothetical protein
MVNQQGWVPLRWPNEPGWWQTPQALDVLRETPINCIVVETRSELAAAAQQRGIAVTTLKEAGVTALTDAEWPQIPMKADGGSGGPTGNPWITSNGWRIELAQSKAPGTVVWVIADPPKDTPVLRTEAYQVAVADAAIHGARWPIALDPKFREALSRHDEGANTAWRRIAETAGRIDPQKAGTAIARLGVCSDFEGPNEFLSHEVLNLASRRLLACRIIQKDHMRAEDLNGLRAVLWIDEKAPPASAMEVLDGFLAAGGTLILPASAAQVTDGLKAAPRQEHSYAIYSKGQGRIAVARQPWNDPFVLAADAHVVMGRRHDVIRMWNAGSCLARYSQAVERGMVQILNFAGREPAHDVSLYVAHPYRTARFTSLANAEPQRVEVVTRETGIEVSVPRFAVYSAVEFGA